ncbi:MAG: NUDIX domain-containing protein [Thermomicrobiales bacterium]|nr:NUDIX domain-containing protein [Thermomicrobiales bacterium]
MTEKTVELPRNTTAVGAVVMGHEGILLVRMTYGPTKGRYMLPGGIVDPGETLDVAVVREVLEETGVEARPVGICGLRTRYDGDRNDNYVIWLLEHVNGSAESDGHENDDARFFTRDELDRDDVTDLSAYFGRLALDGELKIMTLAEDFDAAGRGRDPESWRLFR